MSLTRHEAKANAKTVEHLKAEGRRRLEVWDTTLPGFGIRVYQTRRKVWFVIARVKEDNAASPLGPIQCLHWETHAPKRARSFATRRREFTTNPLPQSRERSGQP